MSADTLAAVSGMLEQSQVESAKGEGEGLEVKYSVLRNPVVLGSLLSSSLGDQDVLLHCGAGSPLRASRILLAAASPLFRLLLRDVTEEAEITITDCSQVELCKVLQYISTGRAATPDQAALTSLQSLLAKLQVGERHQQAKPEPGTAEPSVKLEPELGEEEEGGQHFLSLVLNHTEREQRRRKRKERYESESEEEEGWRSDIINSLYEDEEEVEEEEKERKPKKKIRVGIGS